MKAYKFLKNDMTSGSGNEPPWREGETREITGDIKICTRGYHSSPNWYDALLYSPGDIACIVDVSKPVQIQSDKQVSRRCTITKSRNAEKVLRAWACDCAERALKKAKVTDEQSWNAVKTARLFNEGKATIEELTAAWSAAWSAAKDAAWAADWSAARTAAWDAAWAAAWSAARTAAWTAAWSAAWAAAWSAAWAAAWSAARTAAWTATRDAARDAARDAEVSWQKQRLDEIMNELFKEAK